MDCIGAALVPIPVKRRPWMKERQLTNGCLTAGWKELDVKGSVISDMQNSSVNPSNASCKTAAVNMLNSEGDRMQPSNSFHEHRIRICLTFPYAAFSPLIDEHKIYLMPGMSIWKDTNGQSSFIQR